MSQHLAAVHRALSAGDISSADDASAKALAADPANLEAISLRGVVLVKLGRHGEALEHFSRILADDPLDLDSLHGAMVCHKALGDVSKALETAGIIISIQPENLPALKTVGQCRHFLGDLEGALGAYDKHLRLSPTPQAIIHLERAAILVRLQRDTEARLALLECLKLEPRNSAALTRLASLHLQHDRPQEALKTANKAIAANEAEFEAVFIRARALAQMGESDRAEEVFREGSAREPGLLTPFGIWLIEEGRLDEANTVLAERLKLDPTDGMAHYYWIETSRSAVSDDLLGTLRSVAEVEESLPESRAYAAYALAKHSEKRKEYEDSFKWYQLANSISFGQKFRHQKDLLGTIDAEVDYSLTHYTAEKLRELSSKGSATARPIFIVGMIRSGTTLLEQIVSSHSQVFGAGELRYWMERGPVGLREESRLAELRDGYESLLAGVGDGFPRVTDKMPLNLRFLGMIHASFPNAKILHIKRNPLDTCFSIYATPFTDPPLFSYNLRNIGTVYKAYARLMEHWKEVIPAENLMTLRYEDLVGDQEATTRRLIEFCGLEWDDACLHPESNTSAVRTPSTLQVRKPVNQGAVERWKNFKPWLGELVEALESDR